MTATKSDGEEENIKSSILLTCIGETGREIYKTFEFAQDQAMVLQTILEKFDVYCNPRKNITMIRHQFFSYKQSEGQNFANFVTELKKRSADCEFSTLKNSLVKDMIICGILDNSLRERMLRETELTLERAIQLGQAAEHTRSYSKQLSEDVDKGAVDYVGRKGRTRRQGLTSGDREFNHRGAEFKGCKFCGGNHKRGSCPAYGKECHACKKKNHFAKYCRKKLNVQELKREAINEDISSEDSDFYLETISVSKDEDDIEVLNVDSVKKESTEWYVKVITNGSVVSFKVDTGAEVNVLNQSIFNRISNNSMLRKSSIKLRAYNGSSIPVNGEIVLPVEFKKVKINAKFIIVHGDHVPVIGLILAEKFDKEAI